MASSEQPGLESLGGDLGGDLGGGPRLLNMENMTLEELQALYASYSKNIQETEWDVLHEPAWRISIIIIYAVVIIFGFLGNLLVVVVILHQKQLHTVTNIFIVTLALADIVLCVFNLPLQLHYQLTDWALGSLMCRVVMPTFAVPIFTSSLAILMIAIDRYILIVFPFCTRMSKKMAVILVAVITCSTIGLAVPLMVFNSNVVIDDKPLNLHKSFCVEQWPSLRSKRIYALCMFTMQFCVPLFLSSIFYTHLYIVLRRRQMKKGESQRTQRNQKTVRILIAVVTTFTLCWLPWNILTIYTEYNHVDFAGKYFKIIDLLLKIFAMSSACINPFLYGWLNDNFRRELARLLGRPVPLMTKSHTNGTMMPEHSKTTEYRRCAYMGLDKKGADVTQV